MSKESEALADRFIERVMNGYYEEARTELIEVLGGMVGHEEAVQLHLSIETDNDLYMTHENPEGKARTLYTVEQSVYGNTQAECRKKMLEFIDGLTVRKTYDKWKVEEVEAYLKELRAELEDLGKEFNGYYKGGNRTVCCKWG